MADLRITSEPDARPADIQAIQFAVDELNMARTGSREFHAVNIFLRDEADALRGGAVGAAWGGWLHLSLLWVDKPVQGRGYGSRLLEAAEAEARAYGCRGAYVETHSFQAPRFYEKRGYEIFAAIEDFPPGHSYYMLRKVF